MTNLAQTYKDVWDWLYDEISALKDSSGDKLFSTVIKTTKKKVQDFPACSITPSTDNLDQMTGTRDWHHMRFEVAVGVASQHMEAGMEEAIDLAQEIYALCRANNQMGGLVHDTHVTTWDPAWEPLGGKYAQHWILLTIRIRRSFPQVV